MGESCNSYTASHNSDTFSSSSFQYQQQALENSYVKPLPAHHSALHSVRKFPAMNVITKKPMNAPLPTSCSKIYKVDPVDFRDVVQRLTGVAEFRSTWLQEPGISGACLLAGEEADGPRKTVKSSFGAIRSPHGFSSSSSSMAWCSSFISSPRALSSLDPSAPL